MYIKLSQRIERKAKRGSLVVVLESFNSIKIYRRENVKRKTEWLELSLILCDTLYHYLMHMDLPQRKLCKSLLNNLVVRTHSGSE